MNTQKIIRTKTTKKKSSKINEQNWNNIKDLIKTRKKQKNDNFKEKYSEVIDIINKKKISLQIEPTEKIIITNVPKNIKPGQIFDIYIDGKNMKIKCPDNYIEGTKIKFKIRNNRNIHNEITELIEIRKTYNIMYKMGRYYGYPNCCINDFVLRTQNDQKYEPIQELAGQYSGYVPCINCSKKIVKNDLSIETFIKHRKCKTSFPINDKENTFVFCKKHARLLFFKKMTFYQITKMGCNDCIDFNDSEDCETEDCETEDIACCKSCII